jgi:hypothetical protein
MSVLESYAQSWGIGRDWERMGSTQVKMSLQGTNVQADHLCFYYVRAINYLSP